MLGDNFKRQKNKMYLNRETNEIQLFPKPSCVLEQNPNNYSTELYNKCSSSRIIDQHFYVDLHGPEVTHIPLRL